MGWRAMECQACGGAVVAAGASPVTTCRSCGAEALADCPRLPRIPERYRPFVLDETAAFSAFRAYHSDGWHDSAIAHGPDAVFPLLVPTLFFSALVTTHWYARVRGATVRPPEDQASRGDQVPAGTFENDFQHRRLMPKYWVASGTTSGTVGVTLSTSAAVSDAEMLALGPFDRSEAVPVPGDLSVPFEVGRQHGRRTHGTQALRERHLKQVQAAHPKAEQVTGSSSVDTLTVEGQLVPIYIAPYTFKGARYRVLINGVTGQCVGKLPLKFIGFRAGFYGTRFGD